MRKGIHKIYMCNSEVPMVIYTCMRAMFQSDGWCYKRAPTSPQVLAKDLASYSMLADGCEKISLYMYVGLTVSP